MIMPMSISNESMFPPDTFSYDDMSDACFQLNGVRPRPHWITTEYGGHVSVVFRVSMYIHKPSVETITGMCKLLMWC